MIHLKIYSILNCFDCIQYHALVQYFCNLHGITYEIIDIDNEQNLGEIISKKLTYIPSTLVYEDDNPLRQAGGLLTHMELYNLVYDYNQNK